MNNQDNPSLAGLVTDLAQNVTTLVQTEARLFRAELSEKLTKAGAGAAEVLGGAICLLAALLVLLQALIIALTRAGLGAGWSSLLVGVVVGGPRRHPAADRDGQHGAFGTYPRPDPGTAQARRERD
ncbi:phage holin family protein [Mesorhizobium sp. LSHC414A00]|uniref:phage holin family protein n=1 Tax=Mesorhizobium sp. LSHC414A00 TaxID=1287287 RepID=UPI000421EA76|nr:phage holin family protein [Mesorhizobium sp. LSHC414A00]